MSADNTFINEVVRKALSGDDEAINSIEDRVIRAKAKAALVKAKRTGLTPEKKEQQNISKSTKTSKSSEVAILLNSAFPGSLDSEENDEFISLKPDNWLSIASWLRDHAELYFDSLQCVTGVDVGLGFLESRYNLHSMKFYHKVEIRIRVPISKPEIPSIEQIWRIGDWFERETYDMLGIIYLNHRDLRRILLPDDWEGFPLRKEYEVSETYHGIPIPKVKEGWE